jgi:undecaprenyl-diphosphatase
LVAVCNSLYFRDRPFRYHEVNLLFYYPSDSSFPSNSAAVVFAVAFGVWWGNRPWGAPLLGLAGVFAFSRVYCGVHYPGDILGALLIGWLSAWILTRNADRLNIVFDRLIGLVRRFNLA